MAHRRRHELSRPSPVHARRRQTRIRQAARSAAAAIVLTTEKDAVRLERCDVGELPMAAVPLLVGVEPADRFRTGCSSPWSVRDEAAPRVPHRQDPAGDRARHSRSNRSRRRDLARTHVLHRGPIASAGGRAQSGGCLSDAVGAGAAGDCPQSLRALRAAAHRDAQVLDAVARRRCWRASSSTARSGRGSRTPRARASFSTRAISATGSCTRSSHALQLEPFSVIARPSTTATCTPCSSKSAAARAIR